MIEQASELGVTLRRPALNSRCALILVDLIKHEVSESHGMGLHAVRSGAPLTYYFDRLTRVALPNAARLLVTFREHALPIVHVRIRCDRDDAGDWPPIHRDHGRERGVYPCRPGIEGYEWAPGFEPAAGEIVLEKRSVSAFSTTGLRDVLTRLSVEQVVVAGVVTNYGVGHTAIDATEHGFFASVAEDACAAVSEETHRTWLRLASDLYLRAIPTSQVADELARARSQVQS